MTDRKSVLDEQCDRANAEFDRIFKPIITELKKRIAYDFRKKKAKVLLTKWGKK